jgi:hypothetical protein
MNTLRKPHSGNTEMSIRCAVRLVVWLLAFATGVILGLIIPGFLQFGYIWILFAFAIVDQVTGEAGWIAVLGMYCIPIVWCGIASFLGLQIYRKTARHSYIQAVFLGLAAGAIPATGWIIYWVATSGYLLWFSEM